MDYRLLYTQKALNDLAAIISHIAEDDADAACHFGSSLIEHIELLVRFSRIGGLIRKRAQIRKLVHRPYLVYYRVRENKLRDRDSSLPPWGA